MNSSLLVNACVSRWKKAGQNSPVPLLMKRKPNWLKVDSATNFLTSFSAIATKPLTIVVRNPTVRSNSWAYSVRKTSDLLKRRKNPAVTSVEECTRAEIGVGAAIAAGNQTENGNWALLVNLVNRISPILRGNQTHLHHLEKLNNPPATNNKNTPSPTRLVIAVTILLVFLFQLG